MISFTHGPYPSHATVMMIGERGMENHIGLVESEQFNKISCWEIANGFKCISKALLLILIKKELSIRNDRIIASKYLITSCEEMDII